MSLKVSKTAAQESLKVRLSEGYAVLERVNADYHQKRSAGTFEMGRDNALHDGWVREWLAATAGTLRSIFSTDLEANMFLHTPPELRGSPAGENIGWGALNNRMQDFLKSMRGTLDMVSKSDPSPTFHVEQAIGSIIGTQENARLTNRFDLRTLNAEIDRRGGDDTAELKRMVQEIQELLQSKDELPKGSLAKFSAMMERHSWITEAVAHALLGWALKGIGG